MSNYHLLEIALTIPSSNDEKINNKQSSWLGLESNVLHIISTDSSSWYWQMALTRGTGTDTAFNHGTWVFGQCFEPINVSRKNIIVIFLQMSPRERYDGIPPLLNEIVVIRLLDFASWKWHRVCREESQATRSCQVNLVKSYSTFLCCQLGIETFIPNNKLTWPLRILLVYLCCCLFSRR